MNGKKESQTGFNGENNDSKETVTEKEINGMGIRRDEKDDAARDDEKMSRARSIYEKVTESFTQKVRKTKKEDDKKCDKKGGSRNISKKNVIGQVMDVLERKKNRESKMLREIAQTVKKKNYSEKAKISQGQRKERKEEKTPRTERE